MQLEQNKIPCLIANQLEQYYRNHLELFNCKQGRVLKIESLRCTVQEDLPKDDTESFSFIGVVRLLVERDEDSGDRISVDYQWKGFAKAHIVAELVPTSFQPINVS